MKTASIISSLFVATALLTSACTPADKAVTDAETRLKIQSRGNRGKSGPGQGKVFKLGGYQISALLMDKQVEALELVRLALQIDDGNKSRSKKRDKVETETGETAQLSIDSSPLLFTNTKGDFSLKSDKNLSIVLTKGSEADVWSLKLSTAKPAKLTLDRKSGEKAFVNFTENKFEVTAESKAGSEGVVQITLTSSGNMNGREGTNSFNENFDIKVTVDVDKESLNQDEVKILKVASEAQVNNKEGKGFKTIIEGTNHQLKAEGLCNTLVGVSAIKSDRSGKKVEFTEDKVKIDGTFFKVDLAECGKRPTVDLSRLLP